MLFPRIATTTSCFRSRIIHQTRLASTYATVELQYDKYIPPNGNEKDQPLVILHGLFGTKRNWQSLSKAFVRDLNRPIYALDLRNHGSSPHAEPMNYSSMAEDVLEWCWKMSLTNISLLGHSMGGKVAMAVALSPDMPEDLLSHLIVADIAPSRGTLSPEFQGKEAQHILSEYEPDVMTRAFLLTNLAPHKEHHPLRFRVPLDIIGDAIVEVGSFPYVPGDRTWEGPTMFIKGTRSKYINNHNIPIAKQFFPHMVLETLEAGHWVHAEKPNEFKKLVTNFITSN
ncbi:AB hydrolase superfamily protein [Abortiporus biennis]